MYGQDQEEEDFMPTAQDFERRAKVDEIHVNGLQRTKDDFAAKQVEGILKAASLKEVLAEYLKAKSTMESLGLFRKVGPCVIDASTGGSEHGYTMSIDVEEMRRFRNFIGTEVDTNEGSLTYQLMMPNIFGRAERLAAAMTYGTRHAGGLCGLRSLSLNLTKPLNGNPNVLWTTGAHQMSVEYPWSAYREKNRLLSTDVKFPSVLGVHSVQWGAIWREMRALNKHVDMAVREQFGHSLKSSVKHTLTRDTRDHPIFPSRGYLLKSDTELAGLGGDAKFIKSDIQMHYSRTVFEYLVLQLSLAGGCAKSFNADSDLHLSDRFYLGGPLTMRGFTLQGCGPRSEGCSLGGNAYCLGGVHLFSPLPFRAGKGGLSDAFRLHAWANAGNVVNLDASHLHFKQLGRELSQGVRLSYGVGLAMNFVGKARIELNYCFPYNPQASDSICKGWQFGIGITFS